MKNKKLFAILTLVCFMFTFMPIAAFADTTTSTVYIAGKGIPTSGNYSNTGESVTENSTINVNFDTKTITLNGANISYTINSPSQNLYEMAGIYISGNGPWTVNLVGNNSITVTSSTFCAIGIGGTLTDLPLIIKSDSTSQGSLNITLDGDNSDCTAMGYYMYSGIMAKTITLQNCTSTLKMNFPDSSKSINDAGGIYANEVTIDNAKINVNDCGPSGTGIRADNTINIQGNNTAVSVEGTADGSYGIQSGNLSITGGFVTASADYSAIHGTTTQITGGTVNATGQERALDGSNITITKDAAVTATATNEDGVAVNMESAGTVTIASGTYSGTIDSADNGTVSISGGNVTGSVNTGTGSTVTVSGGSVGSISTGTDSTVSISGTDTKVTGDITMAGTSETEGATASLTISSGSVAGTINAGSGTTATVSGGSFSEPVNPAYLAESLNAQLKTTDSEGKTVYTYHSEEDAKKAAEEAAKENGAVVEIGKVQTGETGSDEQETWTPLTYKVTFKDSDSVVATKDVEWNNKVTDKPADPTKDGYTFGGWYNGETKFDFENTVVTDDITLTAKWTKTSAPSASSGGGGFTGTYNYPVTPSVSGADVTLSDSYATKGETVTITVDPDAGKKVDEVIVTDKDGNIIPVTRVGDNQYTFVMPEGKVNVAVTTEAADYDNKIVLQIGNKNVVNNNKTISNDVAPVIVGDRTLVPVRVIIELLGGTADWNEDTRTVTLTIDGKVFQLVIDKEIPGFGTSATIMNDRTYVPIRYVAEKLGANVDWIAATQQIIIEQ